jgi:thiosulfate dehydrogenase [quinone] large subunit
METQEGVEYYEDMNTSSQFAQPRLFQFLYSDTRMSWVWLVVRLYVGWEWLQAGWEKVMDPQWVGLGAGTAIKGFLAGALTKTVGMHPDVSSWYAGFIRDFAVPHAHQFSYFIAYGEVLVGIALILGVLTGIAAFFGVFMNLNYLLAGTVSVNPQLLVLGMLLMLAWRTAGWLGLDRWVLPKFLGKR